MIIVVAKESIVYFCRKILETTSKGSIRTQPWLVAGDEEDPLNMTAWSEVAETSHTVALKSTVHRDGGLVSSSVRFSK